MRQIFTFLLFALLAMCARTTLGYTSAEFSKGIVDAEQGDWDTALKEWMSLAAGGEISFETNRGLMYSLGQGVPMDAKEAVRWLRLAAEKHDEAAPIILGIMFEKGYLVPQDAPTACMWFSLADSPWYANPDAFRLRNAIAHQMNPVQIQQCKALVSACEIREWKDPRPADCSGNPFRAPTDYDPQFDRPYPWPYGPGSWP